MIKVLMGGGELCKEQKRYIPTVKNERQKGPALVTEMLDKFTL